MKQILLMIAVVALVGCGKKPAEEPVFNQGRPDITKPSKPPAKTEAQIEAETKAFAETKAEAEAGDAEAQFNLGFMYRKGQEVEQDFKEAVKWYQKAADQGYAIAQFNLGVMYERGKGVKQDFKEAVKWYQKAADQGLAEAQSNLGFMYANGQGVEQDFKEAVKWSQKAADQGLAEAQYSLGYMYSQGLGVVQDFKEAVKWHQKAAYQGNAGAQSNLAVTYYNGEGVEQNYITAYAWASIAATNGSTNAPRLKSEFPETKMTPAQIAKAEELVKEMVEKNPKLLNKGSVLEQERPDITKPPAKTEAQIEAENKALNKALAEANAKAEKWYQKAAVQGNAGAQFNLGVMYANGQGVEQNFVTAYAWLNIAATNGNQNAKKGLPQVAKDMTPAQIAKARELVKEMIKKNPKLLKKKE